jgi:hypothetical protein
VTEKAKRKKKKIRKTQKMSLPSGKSLKSVGQKMFRTRTSLNVDQQQRSTNDGPRCVEQIRQMTWLEVRRLWSTGLSGYWALAVFLVVGHAACHITGPSVILSVILAAITSALSGKFFLFFSFISDLAEKYLEL